MKLLCSLPFFYYTNDHVEFFVVVTDVYVEDNWLIYHQDGMVKKTYIGFTSFIERTRHGYKMHLGDGMWFYFLNLVPVTDRVLAQLNLVGK